MSIFKEDFNKSQQITTEIFAQGFFGMSLQKLKKYGNIPEDRDIYDFLETEIQNYQNLALDLCIKKSNRMNLSSQERAKLLLNEYRRMRKIYLNNFGHYPEYDFPAEDLQELQRKYDEETKKQLEELERECDEMIKKYCGS